MRTVPIVIDTIMTIIAAQPSAPTAPSAALGPSTMVPTTATPHSAQSISSLDQQTLMLVRIAALVAVDGPPASYLLNLGAASDVGVDEDTVRGVLAAVAPIVGTARVASAASKIVRALGLAELEEEAEGPNG